MSAVLSPLTPRSSPSMNVFPMFSISRLTIAFSVRLKECSKNLHLLPQHLAVKHHCCCSVSSMHKYSVPVLFFTDFPSISWVVQFDCPETADTYIHRVGRTARYKNDGQALLFLAPSEKDEMLKLLATRKIPISEIK